ncbi:MAG TPA: hypothetical protein VK653_18470 [Xanthobacteraceae bacterium]|nr:hypothetical protein [Xanthobacteraceae bacterium]
MLSVVYQKRRICDSYQRIFSVESTNPEDSKSKQAPDRITVQSGLSQGSGVMINTAYAVAVSAIVAALFVAFPSLSPQVGAVAPIAGAKGDRADIRPLGVDCGEKAWPYFDAACTRDGRIPLAQPRDIRVISAERIANADPAH